MYLAFRLDDGIIGQTSTSTVTILITDINDETPVLTVPTVNITIAESIATGTWLTAIGISAVDADAGDVLTYNMSGISRYGFKHVMLYDLPFLKSNY